MTLVVESRIELACEYDEDDDILYAWVGESPAAAITYETDEGHLVRLDPVTKELVGVTIFDYKERWSDRPIHLQWEIEIEAPAHGFISRLAGKRISRERVEERYIRPLQLA